MTDQVANRAGVSNQPAGLANLVDCATVAPRKNPPAKPLAFDSTKALT